MDTPYRAVCPQIEQDSGDESPVFSNLNGVPTTSSFHIPEHFQTTAVNTAQCWSLPILTYSDHPLGSAGTDPVLCHP